MEIFTVEVLHRELKKHIATNPEIWETRQMNYGDKLINEGDIITKTFFIEKGIIKVKKVGDMSAENIIVNLFAEHNPCMPLSLYEGMAAEFEMSVVDKENIIHTIDIKTLRKIQETNEILREVLRFVIRRMYKDVFILRDLAAVKPFSKQFKMAIKMFPCLARMQFEDVLDFFRVDEKTLEKQLEDTAKRPKWIASISEIIAKKIEELMRNEK